MASIVFADIKFRSEDTNKAKLKSQKDVKSTNNFFQTQKEDLILIDHKNVSNFKQERWVYFSKIHKEVYELARSKQSISEKITFALKVIEESLKQYGPDGVSLSFNGGKDCVVLLHLFAAVYYEFFKKRMKKTKRKNRKKWKKRCRKNKKKKKRKKSKKTKKKNKEFDEMPSIQAIYITHPNPFLEVEEYVKKCADQYFLDIITIEGSMKDALTAYLKQRPKVKAILVGTRRNDPHGGKLSEFTPTDPGWPQFMRVHPILDMHYTQVWEFLRTLNIPYCVLYDIGYTSLGSRNNTYPNPDLINPSQPSGYDPAWKLKDESRERCGRGNKKQEIPSLQSALTLQNNKLEATNRTINIEK